MQRGVQGAHVDAQLQRIGGRHAPQLAVEQRRLDLAPLLRSGKDSPRLQLARMHATLLGHNKGPICIEGLAH